MKTNLKFNLLSSLYGKKHPLEVIKELGITYQHSTVQSISDCWIFWNCENIPNPLPEYLKIIEIDPMKCVGFGLNQKDAIRISNYNSQNNQVENIKSKLSKLNKVIKNDLIKRTDLINFIKENNLDKSNSKGNSFLFYLGANALKIIDGQAYLFKFDVELAIEQYFQI